MVKIILKLIKDELKNNLDYGENRAKKIRKQIETLQKRLSKPLDLYTDSNIDKNAYDTKNKEWQYELDELLIKQSEINKTPIEYIERARDLFELCKNAREWYLQADYEKKRELLKLLHSNFLYDGSNTYYEPKSVFKYMFDLVENYKESGIVILS